MGKSIADMIDERHRKLLQGNWYPAANGTEERFTTRTGRILQYMYQPSSGKHAYLDCLTDLILTDEEAFSALAMF